MVAEIESRGARPSKRERIIQAAVQSFLDRDYAQVKVEEIAEIAGVGKGTIYEYFSSKEELFMAGITTSIESYFDLFDQFYEHDASCWKNLRNIMHIQLRFLLENSRWVRFLYNERPVQIEGLEEWFIERRRLLIQGIEGLIVQGVRDGEVRRDIDTGLAARCFNAIHFVVLGGMMALDGIEITEEHLDRLMDLFWKGVGADV
jgi:TetR/AcrR family fatty acid metabolism transcriptional regulator